MVSTESTIDFSGAIAVSIISSLKQKQPFKFIWMFPKILVPPNHPMFNRVFHDFHHPFWGTIIFGNTHFNETTQGRSLHGSFLDVVEVPKVILPITNIEASRHPRLRRSINEASWAWSKVDGGGSSCAKLRRKAANADLR